jgi:hypothetical protein
MSFDLKVSLQQRSEPSAQQKKLNRLIDKIEQQKVSLAHGKMHKLRFNSTYGKN